ncbi:MAG: hypothetical protein ABIO21_22580, partial [Pseudomonas sp.]
MTSSPAAFGASPARHPPVSALLATNDPLIQPLISNADDEAPTMADLYENPMGLMGFEFIEFASPTPNTL